MSSGNIDKSRTRELITFLDDSHDHIVSVSKSDVKVKTVEIKKHEKEVEKILNSL